MIPLPYPPLTTPDAIAALAHARDLTRRSGVVSAMTQEALIAIVAASRPADLRQHHKKHRNAAILNEAR